METLTKLTGSLNWSGRQRMLGEVGETLVAGLQSGTDSHKRQVEGLTSSRYKGCAST